MDIQPSYYAVIPATVRYNKNLKANEKLLYGEITALASSKGYCFASNGYFAELYGVSKVSISNWVSNLEKNGYITTQLKYAENSKQIEARYIYINDVPIKENFNTPKKEVDEGHKENFNTPIKENFKDNNTSINNTRVISSTTITSVSSEVNQTDEIKKVLLFYENNFGVIKPSIIDTLTDFVEIFKDSEQVIYAMQKAVDNNATFGYAKSIMERWLNAKLMTLKDIKADEVAFNNRKQQRSFKRGSTHKEIIPSWMKEKSEQDLLNREVKRVEEKAINDAMKLSEEQIRKRLNDIIGG